MTAKENRFFLYKIYSEHCLLYLGRTKQPLDRRLHSHFFKTAMVREINIDAVAKIEYAELPSEADMNVYEVYYINKFKPVLNRDDKAKDQLTISLPKIPFKEYNCHLMDKWRKEIRKADAENEEKRRLMTQLEQERLAKHKEVFDCEDMSLDEKRELWWRWMETVYEPLRNGLL